MKNFRWINLSMVAATLVAASVQPVFAQAPAPGTTTTTTQSTTDAGAITNVPTDTTVTSTTTTTTEVPIATVEDTDTTVTETTEYPNTGGAPLLMSLSGLALAGSAFFMRRRLDA